MFLSMFAVVSSVSAQVVPDANNFTISVDAGAEYSDNRDASETDKESNFDLYVRPTIGLMLQPQGGLMIDFYYAPYLRYRTNPSIIQNDSDLFHDLGVVLNYELLDKLDLLVDEHFNYTDDPAVSKTGTIIRRDSSFKANDLSGRMLYEISKKSNVELNARSYMKMYDESEVAKQSDEDNMKFGAAYWFSLYKYLGAVVLADVSDYNYSDQTSFDRSMTATSAGVGFEAFVNKNLRGGLRVGMQELEYASDLMEGDNSPFVSLGVVSQDSRKNRLSGSVVFQTRNADVYPYASQEAVDFNLKWELQPTEIFSLGLIGQYHLGQYSADKIPVGYEINQYFIDTGYPRGGDEKVLMAGVELAYHLKNKMKMSIMPRIEKVDSDVSTSYDRNSINVFVSKPF